MKRMSLGGICGLVLSLLLTLAGCSEAGTSSDSTQVTNETLYSVGGLDGHVISTGALSDSAWGFSGDTSTNSAFKPVVSFNLSTLPGSATVTSATLRVYLTDIGIGAHPLSSFGGAKVDHITFGTFDVSVYSSSPLRTFASYIATAVDTAVGYKELDVTQAVQDDLNQSRAYSQYRLYHADLLTNNDGTEDSIAWLMAEAMTDGDATNNYGPELVVNYTE